MTYIGTSLRKVADTIDDEMVDMGPTQRRVFLRALGEEILRRIANAGWIGRQDHPYPLPSQQGIETADAAL